MSAIDSEGAADGEDDGSASIWARLLPWLFVLAVAPVAAVGLAASAEAPCALTSGAFESGAKTTASQGWIVSSCEVERVATGSTVKETSVNWAGVAGALALLASAWFFGALLTGRRDRHWMSVGLLLSILAGFSVVLAWFWF